MKKQLCVVVLLAIIAYGCQTKNSRSAAATWTFPDVIPVDSANKMLSSYLNSINYQNNDTDVQAVIFDAGLLRKYLDSFANSSNIAYLKIMFAHKLSYINDGYGNRYAGFSNKALTLIIVGYTNMGTFVLYPDNLAIDNGMLCPTNCPPGAASNPLLPVPNQ